MDIRFVMTKMFCLLILLFIAFPVFSFNDYQNQPTIPEHVKLDARQDSLLNMNLELFFREYYRFGKLTENMRTISNSYKTLFRSMFSPDAMVYDFLITNQLIDIDGFIEVLIKEFPHGISFIDIKKKQTIVYLYDKKKYLASVDVGIEKTVHEGSDDIQGRTHAEDLVFNILFNKDVSLNSFLIESIRKPSFPPIPEVTIEIIYHISPSKKMEGVELLLISEGEVIQTQKSNSENIVRFFAVPSNTQTHIRLAEDLNYKEYETLVLDPLSDSIKERKLLFIRSVDPDPLVTADQEPHIAIVRKPSWLIGFNLAPSLASFNLGDYRLTGTYDMPNVKSRHLGFTTGFEVRYRRYILDNSFSLDFGAGVQINAFGFSYERSEIHQETPAGNIHSFNDFKHNGNVLFLQIPLSVYLKQEKAWSVFDARYAYFRFNLSNAIGKSFTQSAIDDSKPLSISRDLFITGLLPSIELGAGLEINTRFPELTFSAGLGCALYLGNMVGFAAEKDEIRDILTENGGSPIFHYTTSSRLFQWGPSFSVIYHLAD